MDSSENDITLENYSSDNSLAYNDTVNRINIISRDILNSTWDEVLMLLSDWQKGELANVDTESGIRCLLGMWFNKGKSGFDEFGDTLCNANWDGTYCWPATPIGTEIHRSCSEIFMDSHLQNTGNPNGEITRSCLENGTWFEINHLNYDICALNEVYERSSSQKGDLSYFVRHMVFVGSILSISCLSVALATFFSYKNLRTQRFTVHIHLMLALLLRFVLLYLITEPFVFHRKTTYRDNDLVCKSIILAYLYSTVVSLMWMLVQGIYLNGKLTTNLLTGESNKKLIFYNILGWAFPAVIVAVYLVAMIINNSQVKCWRGYSDMIEIWIILTPIFAALAMNGLFLINILRVVIQKPQCQSTRPERSNLISVAKATLVLFPVLGLNNLLLIYNPGGFFDKYFVSLNTFFGSTQGIFVAVVYCFMSKEVQETLRRSYSRFCARRNVDRGTQRNQYSLAGMFYGASNMDDTFVEVHAV